jgi:hypothetical protein
MSDRGCGLADCGLAAKWIWDGERFHLFFVGATANADASRGIGPFAYDPRNSGNISAALPVYRLVRYFVPGAPISPFPLERQRTS